MFNLLVGRELQGMMGQTPQQCFMMPILVGTDGVQKMSKSLGNTISVTDPPDEIFGRTMSVPDAALAEYYEVASTFPPEEIARARTALEAGTENPAVLKRKLARHFIERFWDTEAGLAAEAAFDRVHVDHQAPEDMPVVTQRRGDSPRWIVDLLRDADLVNSGGEARRLITQRGVAVDGQVITDPNAQIPLEDNLILRVGKRRFARVKLES
jgi:tyrosyl-tRNA synthetase